MGNPPDQTCYSCEQSMSGYTRSELEADGWIWTIKKGTTIFVMCPECLKVYAKRREAKRAS